MANIAHASLTGSEIHEPKGIASATAGTVYVSNGSGSGSWSDVGTASFTGAIADFITPIAPSGWLELDGSTISTSTYSALYGVLAMQITGTRTNGSAIITSIASTANIKSGYYVFGTGIASGTTVLNVDSGTQITLSANASSSGTATFAISPWLLDTGTIKLPDLLAVGRYRRSRTSTTKIGDLLADQNQAHTHSLSVTGTTSTDGSHTHTANVTDLGHSHGQFLDTSARAANVGAVVSGDPQYGNTVASRTAVTGITVANVANGSHSHTVSSTGTSGSTGSTEARPLSIVVMTCIKT